MERLNVRIKTSCAKDSDQPLLLDSKGRFGDTSKHKESILFLCSASAYRDDILKTIKKKKKKLGGKLCGNLPFWKLDASSLGHKSLFRAVEPSCTYRKLQYPLVFLFS